MGLERYGLSKRGNQAERVQSFLLKETFKKKLKKNPHISLDDHYGILDSGAEPGAVRNHIQHVWELPYKVRAEKEEQEGTVTAPTRPGLMENRLTVCCSWRTEPNSQSGSHNYGCQAWPAPLPFQNKSHFPICYPPHFFCCSNFM